MKILLVHNHYQQPGGEDVVFAQERQLLRSHGHQVVTYQRSNIEIESYSIFQKLTVPKRAVWSADSRTDIFELIRREKPALVHIHNTFIQISPSILSACQELGVPVVQTLHNFRLLCPAATFFRNGTVCEECLQSLWSSVRHGCYRESKTETAMAALMLAIHRRWHTWDNITSFITLTPFSKRKFATAGFPSDKLFVKPNFVFPDPGEKTNPGESAVYVGRLSPEKGVGTLLRACRRLPTHVSMQIIGDGPLRASLERQASQDGLLNVTFRGRLSRAEAQAAIKNARCVILPSECYENFPMAVVEAFACGTPVICSRLGAMQEIVKHGVTGLQFAAGDADDLARQVEWMWEHPREACAMGKTARREFEQNYTADANYVTLMDIYNKAISSNGHSQP